jgi:toxin HigB-1
VILRFRHKGFEGLFTTGNARDVSAQHLRKIQLILAQLNISRTPSMMDAPGLKFHALVGDRQGQWAVWVSGNWRIVFEFEGENATNVDLVDYHWDSKGEH